MAKFDWLNFDYSNMTLAEGASLYKETGGGIRKGIAYGYTCRGEITPGPHWSGTWVNTQGMGNHGVHVMVPVSREAKIAVHYYWVDVYVGMGLSHTQAHRLASCRVKYKHELIDVIVEAVKDRHCHEAFAKFPGVGPGRHNKWLDKWKDVVGHYVDRCPSWARGASLVEIVNLVVGGNNE